MKKLLRFMLIATPLFLTLTSCSLNSKENNIESTSELTLSVAASLKESMLEIKELFEKEHTNIALNLNFGSSGSLQQQIEQGAPCNLFISAGQSQMNALEEKGLIENNTRKDLLKNALVLIGSPNSNISDIQDLTTDKVKHIAIGEPASVPAGKYADEVITNLNIKDTISDKLVFAKDVKEVLSWVSTDNAEVGFVYKSDTIAANSIKVIKEFPDTLHSPINYPIAIIKDNSDMDNTKKLYDYLNTDEAKEIFKKYGYEVF